MSFLKANAIRIAGFLVCAGFLFFLTIVAVFSNISGNIELGNTDKLAQTLKETMINRSYSMKISFRANVLDTGVAYFLADELSEKAFCNFNDPKAGDYLRFQYGGFSIIHNETRDFKGYIYEIEIIPDYYTDKEKEDKTDEAVNAFLEEAEKSGIKKASDFEKILYVHDFIKNNVSYDIVHKTHEGSGHLRSTAYGALVLHTATCQGYAVLAYRLLKELSVDNRVITGDAYSEDAWEHHAWNIVCVDGLYYNLDVTMDDTLDTYDYFLTADKDISKDHIRDEKYDDEDFRMEYPMTKESYVFDSN